MATKAAPVARPTSVRIFGRTYSITYVPENDPTFEHLGLTDNSSHNIWCVDGQPLVEEKDTILHEVLHAIRATMRVEVDPEIEERMVLAFATGLIGIFEDNPEFAKWLVRDIS